MLDKFFDAFHVFITICLIFDNCVMQAKIKNLQNDVLGLFNKIDYMDNIEQRCGTCTKRYTCPAWPGVVYPCPHYNDQDGIMEEKLRKDLMDDD